MVIDTSAILSILEQEADARAHAEAIAADPVRLVSAATVVEAGIVMTARHGRRGAEDLDLLLRDGGIEIVPITATHARLAREGFARFGKGRHAAALNYGDCFSYALARAARQPLLCKGDDFSRTDVEVVSL